jgi:hypothetical protein
LFLVASDVEIGEVVGYDNGIGFIKVRPDDPLNSSSLSPDLSNALAEGSDYNLSSGMYRLVIQFRTGKNCKKRALSACQVVSEEFELSDGHRYVVEDKLLRQD